MAESASPVPEAATDQPPRFHDVRRSTVRHSPPWHRLAYIIRELPAGLERLATGLPFPPEMRVLDYGCADIPYRRLFPADATYLAADLPGNPQATVEIAPDGTVPVDDESVDVVLSTQVLEHVIDPGLYLSECRRVLRPGGKLLLSTHGVMVYHPDPEDYWRWTCAGLHWEVRQAGLEVERFEGIMGLGASGLQLFQDALYWRLPRLARDAFALVIQSTIALVDRLESAETRRVNALVFALVATRP
jgi:SAM-dependent methyltransferase